MERKVINPKNLPANLPIFRTLLVVMALKLWDAPQWLWGAALTLVAVLWVFCIYLKVNQKYLKLYEQKGSTSQAKTSADK